eukprot:TRINITY_DN13642_c0_g1_i6.p3 TRINITY_DN13642_c0_g1~~TRINITY_DN13642_c0_g1_i6.p3  ORF type:complete len:130 (-),score=2.05 TRINITY_DN13642_c0_g1_i6:119-469(-)
MYLRYFTFRKLFLSLKNQWEFVLDRGYYNFLNEMRIYSCVQGINYWQQQLKLIILNSGFKKVILCFRLLCQIQCQDFCARQIKHNLGVQWCLIQCFFFFFYLTTKSTILSWKVELV